jgi:hypothetical protein
MNLGMFDRFCPSLKTRAQLEERVDLNKFDRNREIYVIPMHRKNFWTNRWMQEPSKNFSDCRSITVIPVHSTRKIGDRLK